MNQLLLKLMLKENYKKRIIIKKTTPTLTIFHLFTNITLFGNNLGLKESVMALRVKLLSFSYMVESSRIWIRNRILIFTWFMQIVLLFNIAFYVQHHSPHLMLCPCWFPSHCQAKSMPGLVATPPACLAIALRTPGILTKNL